MSRPTQKPRHQAPTPPSATEVVSPVWLVKAIGLTVIAAMICGYLTLCALFYQGQWQLVLHPARTTASPASIAGVPYQLVHFGIDESATPQLTGWWIPADPTGRYANTTLLFLPGGEGSIADSVPLLANLHTLGINVFAFDYRGFGQSAAVNPSQTKMLQDADRAWQYLTNTRGISDHQIVPYGVGLGASIAVHLAVSNETAPAVILNSPHGDLLTSIIQDPRSSFMPVRLLFHERFPLAQPLSTLATPKLLLSSTSAPAPAFVTAAAPKLMVELPSPSASLEGQSILRFLDEYLAASGASQPLVSSPAPSR